MCTALWHDDSSQKLCQGDFLRIQMNKSKNKGDREERDVVNTHLEWGIFAKRTLEAGARSNSAVHWDIDLYHKGKDAAPLIGECKVRKDGFKKIYDWLHENDFLTIRADRKERLYVVPERIWKELIK